MKKVKQVSGKRLDTQAGIAIRPIIFIIVVLVIISAAIIFGSSNIAADKVSDGNHAKARALIEIGETLKTGADHLTVNNKIPFNQINTDPTHTEGTNALFSPDGGGVVAPSYALANSPSKDGTPAHGDIWLYPRVAIPGLGSSEGDELLAVLSVSESVCKDINETVNSVATPPASDLGNLASIHENKAITKNWPEILSGRTAGCVQNSAMNNRYFFFQVLVIQ